MALHSDDIYYGSYPASEIPAKEFKPYNDYNYYIKRNKDGVLLQNPGDLPFVCGSTLITITLDSDLKIIKLVHNKKPVDISLLPAHHIECDSGEKDLFKRNQINFKILKVIFEEPIDSLLD